MKHGVKYAVRYGVVVLALGSVACDVEAPGPLVQNVEAASSGVREAPAPAPPATGAMGAPAAAPTPPPASEQQPLDAPLAAPGLAASGDEAPDAGAPDASAADATAADDPVGESSEEPASDEGTDEDDDASDDESADEDDADDEDDGDDEEDPPRVTISFTFDDTYGPQREAAEILEAHGLRGTFYVNSPQLHRATANPGPNAALSISDVLGMQARGHDIGGHTLGHLSLTAIPEAERVREILGDRAELVHLGIEARSFAYPYGHVEDDDPALGEPVLEIARGSGYDSARDTNGFDLADCSPGPEARPPRDPFILRSIRSVNEPPDGETLRVPADDAETLLGWIDRVASCGGGWLPLVFHHLRDDCSAADAPQGYCFDYAQLDRLAAALEDGERCPDGEDCFSVGVATASAVIGRGDLLPAPEVPGLRNASLERTLDSGQTECIRRTGAGDGALFSRSSLARSGSSSDRLELTPDATTSAELGIERDYGECAIFARPGSSYQLSLSYRADPNLDTPTLRFATYRLRSDYVWVPWQTGDAFEARDPGDWVRLQQNSGAVPADTLAISFGLRIESPGAINLDDVDSVPLGD